MNELWVILVIAFLTGITASLGLGGGFILVVYLTIFTETAQLQAQGINLLFFIPIAVLSLVIHIKNGFIEKKILPPCILFSVIGAVIGVLFTGMISSELLSKLFAAFILIIGLKEIWTSAKEIKNDRKNTKRSQTEFELFVTKPKNSP